MKRRIHDPPPLLVPGRSTPVFGAGGSQQLVNASPPFPQSGGDGGSLGDPCRGGVLPSSQRAPKARPPVPRPLSPRGVAGLVAPIAGWSSVEGGSSSSTALPLRVGYAAPPGVVGMTPSFSPPNEGASSGSL